jgi:hypothetical protein
VEFIHWPVYSGIRDLCVFSSLCVRITVEFIHWPVYSGIRATFLLNSMLFFLCKFPVADLEIFL